ncbi:MAG: hypothetical protein ACYC5O_00020 [Anaerolineae bacterium]
MMHAFGDLYLARMKRSLLVGCLTTVIGGPVMCVGLLLLIEVILPALERSDGSNRPIVLALLFVSVTAAMIGVPLAVAGAVLLRRARALDAVFAPLGLSGSTYMLTGRHYQGSAAGRDAHVYAYRGPAVEVRL